MGSIGANQLSKTPHEMITALHALKNYGPKGTKENPLFDIEHALDSQKAFTAYSDLSPDAPYTTQNVDMGRLLSNQPYVVLHGMENAINNTGAHEYSSKLPVGVEYNGKVYLMDGNHRAVVAYLRGDKKLKVKVYQV